ncbi:TPA: phage tail protein [Citrobacter freundii]
MSAGTLTLTNNSAAVSGSGTAFTTELAAGDFIVVTVGGIPYTLPVKTVNSNTSATLVSNFTGPTQSGAAWYAVPRVAMNLVTAALVTQSAEALRGLNYDKQNWQSIFSGSGNVTVKLPDGSTFTGPAWSGIVNALNKKADSGENSNITSLAGLTTPLSVKQGGTGAGNQSDARDSLGLKGAATRDVQTSLISDTASYVPVMLQMNCDYRSIVSHALFSSYPLGMTAGIATGSQMPGSGIANDAFIGALTVRAWGNNSAGQCNFQIAVNNNVAGFRPAYQDNNTGVWYFGSFLKWYHSGNTTRASDGTLKAASPIVKIFHDGQFETNDEAEGVTVSRINTGEYLIDGCTGLNSDAAWGGIDGGFDIPKDRNRQPLIWLDYQVNSDGSVLVKTFHRTYPEAPIFARNLIGMKDGAGNVINETVKNGDPIDIPSDQYVSVRVEMPSDSIWHQKQKDTQMAMDKTEREPQQNQQDTQS